MNPIEAVDESIPKDAPHNSGSFLPRLRNELHKVIGRGYRGAFLLAFLVAALAQSSAYIYTQLEAVHDRLYADFKVLVLPEQGLSQDEQEALARAIAAVPGVAQSHFVSKSELLDFLRLRDPETARVALAFGENPVPEFFEVKPAEHALASAAAWVQGAFRDGKVPGVADVLFKQGEADAVVYSAFCSKFMRLMLALSALALVLFCVFAEFSGTARRPGGLSSAGWVLSGMTGAAFAVFVAWAVVYPVRYLTGWWLEPFWLWHAGAVLSGAFIGRALCRWSA